MKLFSLAFSSMVALLILSGCVLTDNSSSALSGTNSSPVKSGRLLVIDQANQVLNAVDFNSNTVRQICLIGEAGNTVRVDGDYAYTVASLSDLLKRMDLKNGGAISNRAFAAGSNPYDLVLDSNFIYVSQNVSNCVTVLVKDSFAFVTNLRVLPGFMPQSVAVDGGCIYITSVSDYAAYSSNYVTVYRKSDYSLVTNLWTDTNGQSLACGGDSLYLACTGKYLVTNANWSGYYAGGGVYRINTNGFAVSSIIVNFQAKYLCVDGPSLYVIESSSGVNKSGLNIFGTNGLKVTNVLAGKNLAAVAFDADYIYCSEDWGGNAAYRIAKTGYSITIVSNTGGGACAFYQ